MLAKAQQAKQVGNEARKRRLDEDGDGISYEEFVDHLARGTVAPAAMGKRGMQAKEAMGVADLDPAFLGHNKKIAHTKYVSLQERGHWHAGRVRRAAVSCHLLGCWS